MKAPDNGSEPRPRGSKKRIPKPENFQPEADWPQGHPWHGSGRPRCQKWNYNEGRQCESQAMVSNGRSSCRVHGGKAPAKGITHHRWVNGKYSTAPVNLKTIYEEAKRNPELLALEDEIAIIDARLIQLVERVDSEAGENLFKKLQQHMREFDKANALANRLAADPTAQRRALAQAADHLNSVRELISDGNRESSIWQDIRINIDLRRRLTESERKTMIDARMLLNAEIVLLQVEAFANEVVSIVRDKKQLAEIREAYNRMPLLNG